MRTKWEKRKSDVGDKEREEVRKQNWDIRGVALRRNVDERGNKE